MQNPIDRMSRPKVLVCGDPMLDRYTWGQVRRVSPEAPVLTLSVDRRESRPGGAANVAMLLGGLEAKVELIGVVGGDGEGSHLKALLNGADIDNSMLLMEPGRSTTVKERLLGRIGARQPHPLMRIDTETTASLAPDMAECLLASVLPRVSQFDGLVISDYAKGVCDSALVAELIEEANRADIPSLVDPPWNQSWEKYRGASVLVPNRRKIEAACDVSINHPSDAIAAGAYLCRELELRAAVITLDSDGLVVATARGESAIFPAHSRQVCDVTGAGDAVIAALAVGLASGFSFNQAAELANVAAGLEVERLGATVVTRAEWRAACASPEDRASKIVSPAALARLIAASRQRGQRVVFTNGCFDLLHVGHVKYLQEAAELGDLLIVAVNSDASVRRLKGPTRPVIASEDRAAMLAALSCVSFVTIFEDDTPHRLLEALRPDVLVKGGTYGIEGVVGREIVFAYGGEVRVVGVTPGVSTTNLLSQIHGNADCPGNLNSDHSDELAKALPEEAER